MKGLKLSVIMVLTLSIFTFVIAPKEARADKDLRITENQFIASCNSCLTNVNLRFVKNEKYKELNKTFKSQWTSSYDFYNGLAPIQLLEASGQLTKIWLTVSSGQKSQTDAMIVKPVDVVTCVARAVLPAESDYERFHRKLEANLLQGLDKFVIKVKGKAFEVFNSPLGMVMLTITPAQ